VFPVAVRSTAAPWSRFGRAQAISPLPCGTWSRDPILLPSLGVFICRADSGLTAGQFREQLAAKGGKTVRQRVREHPEQDAVAALSAVRGIGRLPDFPVPPYEPPMKIDVPDPVLNQQWRLGAWHLRRHAVQLADGSYCLSILAGQQGRRRQRGDHGDRRRDVSDHQDFGPSRTARRRRGRAELLVARQAGAAVCLVRGSDGRRRLGRPLQRSQPAFARIRSEAQRRPRGHSGDGRLPLSADGRPRLVWTRPRRAWPRPAGRSAGSAGSG